MAIMWDSGSQDAGSIPVGTTKYGFSSVGGSVGLQNQRSEVRILQPAQAWSYGVGGCLLAGLKIQRLLFDSRWLRKFAAMVKWLTYLTSNQKMPVRFWLAALFYNAVVV